MPADTWVGHGGILERVDPHREIELKLDASLEDLRRLQRHPLVRSLSQGRAVTRTLESVYYDTEDHDLAQANVGLRVRRDRSSKARTRSCGSPRCRRAARPADSSATAARSTGDSGYVTTVK